MVPVSPQTPDLETFEATIDNVGPLVAKGVGDVTMYKKAVEVVTLGVLERKFDVSEPDPEAVKELNSIYEVQGKLMSVIENSMTRLRSVMPEPLVKTWEVFFDSVLLEALKSNMNAKESAITKTEVDPAAALRESTKNFKKFEVDPMAAHKEATQNVEWYCLGECSMSRGRAGIHVGKTDFTMSDPSRIIVVVAVPHNAFGSG
ncbi:MAG: hypothetical protein Q9161_007039 [Pseudevernia consocians]